MFSSAEKYLENNFLDLFRYWAFHIVPAIDTEMHFLNNSLAQDLIQVVP